MTEGSANGAGIGSGADSNLMGISDLIGSSVQNHKGEYLGELKEVMLDAYSGQASYAVLSFAGGFLGIWKKFFAVPWSALSFDSKNGCVVLQVEKDRLQRAPGFDKDSWPNTMDDSSWWREIQSYYRHNAPS